MLPNDHQQRYRELRVFLEELCTQVATDRPDGTALRESVQRTQEFFAAQVLSLPFEGFDRPDKSGTQSYNTELHKQLRLLATDVLFLGSARHAATVQQRQAQLRERLTILLHYCDILLGEDSSPV